MTIEFEGKVWYWRGPAPFYFVTVPPDHSQALREIMKAVTYGWGMILVRARVGETDWETAMFPKDGNYVLPLKDRIRKAEGIEEGSLVQVTIAVKDAHRPG